MFRKFWMGAWCMVGLSLFGCGAATSIEKPENPDPLPTAGPQGMSPAGPPPVKPPQ